LIRVEPWLESRHAEVAANRSTQLAGRPRKGQSLPGSPVFAPQRRPACSWRPGETAATPRQPGRLPTARRPYRARSPAATGLELSRGEATSAHRRGRTQSRFRRLCGGSRRPLERRPAPCRDGRSGAKSSQAARLEASQAPRASVSLIGSDPFEVP
jgi:hypothetical protein